jgi:hypothetical protein
MELSFLLLFSLDLQLAMCALGSLKYEKLSFYILPLILISSLILSTASILMESDEDTVFSGGYNFFTIKFIAMDPL